MEPKWGSIFNFHKCRQNQKSEWSRWLLAKVVKYPSVKENFKSKSIVNRGYCSCS